MQRHYPRICLALLMACGLATMAAARETAAVDFGPDDDRAQIVQTLGSMTKIGPLTIRRLPAPSIQVDPVHNIDGDLLFPVIIDYDRNRDGDRPLVQVGILSGSVRLFRFTGYMALSSTSPNTNYLLKAEPGKFFVEIDADPVAFPTGFGSILNLERYWVQIQNVDQLLIAKPGGRVSTRGTLELTASDLTTDRLAMRFEGEGNAVDVAAEVSLPGQSVWSFDIATQRVQWVSGTLRVNQLALRLDPRRRVRMAALDIETSGLHADRLDIVKTRQSEFGQVTLTDFRFDIGALRVRKPKVSGTFDKQVAISKVEGWARSREEFFDFLGLKVFGLTADLVDGSYEDDAGLSFTADTLRLDLEAFREKQSGDDVRTLRRAQGEEIAEEGDDEKEVPGYVRGSIVLETGELDLSTADLAIDATLRRFELNVDGDPDALDGSGHLSATLHSASGELGIDDPFERCPNRDAGIRLHLAAAVGIDADLDLDEGEVSGNADVAAMAAVFEPRYYRCEWDHRLFKQRMFNLCTRMKERTIAGIKVKVPETRRCDYDLEAKVHIVAEILEAGPIAGAIQGARFELDEGKTRLCSGNVLLRGPVAVSVGPNLNDCGDFACNLFRDAIRAATATAETTLLTGIANSLPPVFITNEECAS